MAKAKVPVKPDNHKSLRVVAISPEDLNRFYTEGSLSVDALPLKVYPNQPLVLKAGESQSALGIVNDLNKHVYKAESKLCFEGIEGRNKEQQLLFALLNNPAIRVLVVTGPAGTGKSICLAAHAFSTVTKDKERKMILSKPLEIVTKTRFWGTVPGDENEKFGPFLKSYMILFESLAGKRAVGYIEKLVESKKIDFMPLELMRGVSLKNAYVWYDEAQNLDAHEMETLGSRIDDVGLSRLVLSGDLNQQDRDIFEGDTGLHRLVNSRAFLESPHTAHIDLIKNERGVVSQLFFDVFHPKSETP